MSVMRIESICPYCRSRDVELRQIMNVSWMHCNDCWQTWDVLAIDRLRPPALESGPEKNTKPVDTVDV